MTFVRMNNWTRTRSVYLLLRIVCSYYQFDKQLFSYECDKLYNSFWFSQLTVLSLQELNFRIRNIRLTEHKSKWILLPFLLFISLCKTIRIFLYAPQYFMRRCHIDWGSFLINRTGVFDLILLSPAWRHMHGNFPPCFGVGVGLNVLCCTKSLW